jgi:hypothetical protein
MSTRPSVRSDKDITGSRQEMMMVSGTGSDTCATNRGSRTRNRGKMHKYVRTLERIAIDVAGPSSGAAKETDTA